MWDALLNVNSVLLIIASVFLVYTLGEGVLLWTWKPFLIALLVTLFLFATEIILGALAD